MVRIVRGDENHRPELTDEQRRKAEYKISKANKKNPLRNVTLNCCGMPQRDPVAQEGDWIWCERCNDWGKVGQVRQ